MSTLGILTSILKIFKIQVLLLLISGVYLTFTIGGKIRKIAGYTDLQSVYVHVETQGNSTVSKKTVTLSVLKKTHIWMPFNVLI